MIVQIGNIDLEISEFQSKAEILNQYAIKISSEALPQYFAISSELSITQDEGNKQILEVTDIRPILQEIDYLDDLLSLLPSLLKIYSFASNFNRMPTTSIIALWLYLKFKNEVQDRLILSLLIEPYVSPLKRIDPLIFSSSDQIISIIVNYENYVQDERNKIKKDLEYATSISQQFNELGSVNTSEFILEESTISWDVEFIEGDTLPIIFDKMIATSTIPFIHIYHRGQNWFKVYESYTPKEYWVEFEPLNEGIYFRLVFDFNNKIFISNGSINSELDRTTELDNPSQGSYYKINLVSPKDTEDILAKLFFNKFAPDIKINIAKKNNIGVKGIFKFEDVNFNRAIFADMITNDPILSYFLFFQEFNQTILNKSKYSFYYSPGHNFVKNSETLLITLTYSSDDDAIGVRISGASSINDAKLFKNIFQKLIWRYIEEFDTIYNFYKNLVGVKSLSQYSKKTKAKRDVFKSKVRLTNLRKQRPDIYEANYATGCQKDAQPYLVTKEKAEELSRILKGGSHKVLNFPRGSEDWYACEPREPDENQEMYLWPGIQINNRMKNKKQYPCIPCCKLIDQYTGEKSKYGFEYVKKEKDQCGESEGGNKEVKGIKFEQMINNLKDAEGKDFQTHIQKGNKVTGIGQFSNLPYNLEYLVQDAGYRKITKGKQLFLPILRTGVLKSPDSFIHCMEKAFNPRYVTLDIEERKKRVMDVRRKISQMNLAYGKQELYDISNDEIIEILLNPFAYIDPAIFISLVSKAYNCNIFLYEIGKNIPNGEILIPRHSQAYLFRDISENKGSVFVTKFYTEDYFQCEIMVKYNPDEEQIFDYIFKNDKLVDAAVTALYDVNLVYSVTPTKIIPKDNLLATF